MSSVYSPPVGLQGNSPLSIRLEELSRKADNIKSNIQYKVVRAGEKNHLAQRVGIEVIGVDLFTVLCELVLRGWKAAAGAGLRISLFVVNSAIMFINSRYCFNSMRQQLSLDRATLLT